MNGQNVIKEVPSPVAKRFLAVTAVYVILAGCGSPPPITEEDLRPADLASIPTWDDSYAGTQIGELVGAGGAMADCIGYIDLVLPGLGGAETRLEGWAWNTGKSEPFPGVLVTDTSGTIKGAGTTSQIRADVSAAMPGTVKDDKVGYVAFAREVTEGMVVYGLDETSDTYCRIGGN